MSGLKQTSIELKREHKARHKAYNKIKRASKSIQGIKKNVIETLAAFPDGVRKSFASDVGAANHWLNRELPEYSTGMGSGFLSSLVKTYKDKIDGGQTILANLIDIKEIKRDEKAKSLLKRSSILNADLYGSHELLDKWRPGQFTSLKKRLDALSNRIQQGDFIVVEDDLKQLNRELTGSCDETEILEKQDCERRYVLDALSEVCHEMGWKTLGPAVLEDANNRESALLFTVNTYAAGNMEFRMTLEGLSVHSPITPQEEACYKDFDTISEKLRQFGILTKFEQVNMNEDPMLRERGERDLPDSGIEMEMER